MLEWDPGPPQAFADLFARAPKYTAWKRYFRLAWGPVFYRGRLDGSARVIVVAQNPGPAELIARRGLAGLAGQRIQGFLARLGLDRSYVMGNAFLYGLKQGFTAAVQRISASDELKSWRNEFFEMLATPRIEAVIAIGAAAQQAVDLWPGSSRYFIARLTHPSYEASDDVFKNWNHWLRELRRRVTPDPGVSPNDTPYGKAFKRTDQVRIPPRDLPFGVPSWFGDGESASRMDGRDWIVWKPTRPVG